MKKLLIQNWEIFLFFFIAIFLIFSWFSHTSMLATGEEGMPFYNPGQTFNLYKSFWYETGTGMVIPVLLPRAPLFFIISLFSNIPMLVDNAQKIVFFFLIISAFLSTYLLGKKLFQQNRSVAFIASLFYFFNTYTMSQILQRFLLTNIFAWAFLPLFVYLWLEILEKKQIKTILAFLISSLIFCYSFGMPAMIITIWLPSFLILLYFFFNARANKKEMLQLGFVYCGITFFWIVINIWWLLPYLQLSHQSFSLLTDWKSNLDSLTGVSQYFLSRDILLLRQSYLFGSTSPWYVFYANPFVIFLSICIFLILLVGVWSSRKEQYWFFLFSLLIVAWFICKGTNPPLGNIFFSFLFSHFSFMTAFRNSYEKAGILFVLPYALFFGYGVYYLTMKLLWKYVVASILLFLCCVVLVWPVWKPDIFAGIHVTVPVYYKTTNVLFDKIHNDGRILQLPMNPGDGIHYNWGRDSYGGVDSSEYLFDRPSLSKILRSQYADQAYMDLYNAFTMNKDYNTDLQNMDVSLLIVHDDLASDMQNSSSSARVRQQLAENPEIIFLRKIGKLYLYQFNQSGGLFIAKGEKVPKISYKKLTTTSYMVSMINAQHKFYLIFKESYDPNWQAQINGKVLSRHTIVYDYANQWEVTKKGSYRITITYKQ